MLAPIYLVLFIPYIVYCISVNDFCLLQYIAQVNQSNAIPISPLLKKTLELYPSENYKLIAAIYVYRLFDKGRKYDLDILATEDIAMSLILLARIHHSDYWTIPKQLNDEWIRRHGHSLFDSVYNLMIHLDYEVRVSAEELAYFEGYCQLIYYPIALS